MASKPAKSPRGRETIKKRLEELHSLYNHREYVHPDPLEFLYDYPDPLDREIVGLIASSLAYGRVAQILKSVSIVLAKMGHSPRAFLTDSPEKDILKTFPDFKHRFTTGKELASMLVRTKALIEQHGSLYGFFIKGFNTDDKTVMPALTTFVKGCNGDTCDLKNSLLPEPHRGSACKRLNLYLRWMVREDEVDPGGWKGIPPSRLIIPLDTHMHRICRTLGITDRKQADMHTALEITDYFRMISPEDPVRYDFAITRLGIRKDAEPGPFFEGLR